MPYIKKDRRGSKIALSPGDLNYQITCACLKYVKNNKLSYQTINDIIGALESAKMELYRRVAVPYERNKMAMNGDLKEYDDLLEEYL